MACQGGHQIQRVLGQQGMQPAQTGHIQLRIGRVLVIGHAPHPFDGQGPGRLGQHRPHLIDTFAHDRVLGHRFERFGLGWRRRDHNRAVRLRQALGKGAQTAFHAQTRTLDGGFKLIAGERQQTHTCQRAEQHRTDDTALLLGQSGHVKTHQALGGSLGMGQQLLGVHTAIAQSRFFGDGIHPVGRCNQGGSVAGDQAALHRAAGFHQLRGQHNVHVSWQGHQGQHRLQPIRTGRGFGKQLNVINGRTGALGHTGHRSGLSPMASVFGQVHDPVGQHATALAAHGEDGDLDGLG